MNKPLIIIFLLAVLLPFSSCALEILPGQILNYSDFSYISSVAVGYEYVYFGTTRGVIRYDISNRRWGEPMTGLRGLLGKQIEELKVSTDDEHIWAKTDQGVFEYTDLFRDWNFVGTMPDEPTNGRHLQPAPVYFPPIGFNYMSDGTLVDNNGRRFPLTDIVDDGWSNLWIGNWGLGALHADNTNLRMEPLQYGLLQEDISTICLDNGVLWMGGQVDNSLRTGITLFDWRRNIFDYIETEAGFTLKTDNINDISVDPANIFVATDNGVWAIDKGNRTINNKLFRNSGLPDNKVLAVLVSGDTLFVGTEFGLGILSISQDSAAFSPNYFLSSLSVYCFEKTRDGLWIGTSQGVYRLELPSGKLGRLTAPELVINGAVHSIKLYGDKIWLVSEDNITSVDLSTAGIQSFPEAANFGQARALAVKDTVVALATSRGLLILFNGEKPHHYLYTINDGLLSNNVKDIVFDGDYLWVGTDCGLTRFWYKNPKL